MRMGNTRHGIRGGFQIMRALHSLLKTLEDFIAGRLISIADMITVQLDNGGTSKEQMLYMFLCSISSNHLFYLKLQKLKFTQKDCMKMWQCWLFFSLSFFFCLIIFSFCYRHVSSQSANFDHRAVSFNRAQDSYSLGVTVLAGTPSSIYFHTITFEALCSKGTESSWSRLLSRTIFSWPIVLSVLFGANVANELMLLSTGCASAVALLIPAASGGKLAAPHQARHRYYIILSRFHG